MWGWEMKPAAFRYSAPTTVAEACALLADSGDEGRVLAGGQSLVPMMNFRLARPGHLVDINRIGALDDIRVEGDSVRIGALTRHIRFERPLAPGPLGALLPRVVRHIAHLPIRTRGTFAGSLAHADPSAEWCALAAMLDAEVTAQGPGGQRTIAARDFFRGVFTTALAPDEIVTEVRLPLLSDEWRTGFCEFSRRSGDYAIVVAMVAVRLSGSRIVEARIALGGVGDRPTRAAAADTALRGAPAERAAFVAAGEAATQGLQPMTDVQATPEYRLELVRVMVRRALEAAMQP
jgi:aerobic carbon-monoxide dehydrogenase medium subunit